MSDKTLEQLLEEHAEMLLTAHDLSITVPEELRAEYSEIASGVAINGALDALIREATAEPPKKAKAAAPKKAKPAPKKAKPAPKKAKPAPKKAAAPIKGKIIWLGKDNPARKNTGRWKRIEAVKRYHNKTVEAYMTTGKGKIGSLTRYVERGLVRISA